MKINEQTCEKNIVIINAIYILMCGGEIPCKPHRGFLINLWQNDFEYAILYVLNCFMLSYRYYYP